jgi:glutathione S-transferase
VLTLYYAPHTCALATHIVLEEVGAAYAGKRIDFASNQQRSPEYLRINPKGRVPALVTDRGILTETPAMLVYVAQSHPKAALAPMDDPFLFAGSSRSTATCARTCTWRTLIACVAIAGSTPTTRLRSPPCSARCRNRSVSPSRWSSARC